MLIYKKNEKLKNIIPLEHIDANDVNFFQNTFLISEKPVILKGISKDWPAIKRWSADFFCDHYGHVMVPVCYYKTRGQELYAAQEKMLLREYIALAKKNGLSDTTFEQPYVGGWLYHKEFPELLNDIDISPPCFPENWLHKLPSSLSVPSTNLLIGYAKVSSPLHTDSFFVNSLLTMIVGEKKARMVSPFHTSAVANGQDLFDPKTVDDVHKKGGDIFEGKISAGDAFYIPPGWWHNVVNCGFTIAVQNLYVDTHRFPLFEQQMRRFVLPILSKLSELGRDAREELNKKIR